MFGPTLTPADFSNTFTPAQIANLLQWFDPTYSPTTLQSLPVFVPKETGTLAVPRAGRCAKFDGSNDYLTANGIGVSGASARTICFHAKLASTSNQVMLLHGVLGYTEYKAFMLWCFGGNWLFSNDTANLTFTAADTNWHHHAVTYDGATIRWFIDGNLIGSGASTLATQDTNFEVGARVLNFYSGLSIYGLRAYNVAKTPTEIAAIYNQHLSPGVIDTAGALGIWPLQEEGVQAEGLHYNVVDASKPLVAKNITASTYNATDTGVKYSFPNAKGYTAGLSPNGFASSSQSNAAFSLQGAFTIQGWISPSGTLSGFENTIAGVDNGSTVRRWRFVVAGSSDTGNVGKLRFIYNAGSATSVYSSGTVANGQWSHVALVFNGSNSYTFYINGVASGSGTTNITPQGSGSGIIDLLGNTSGGASNISLSRLELFSVAKTGSEVAASMTSMSDTSGLVARYMGRTETVSGNNLTSGTELIIPASLTTPTLDAAGNALGVAGPVALPAGTEVNCFTGDGAAAHINFGAPYIPNADVTISFLYWPVVGAFYDRVISQTSGGAGGFELVQNDTGTQLMLFIDGDAGTLSTLATTVPGAWNFTTVTRVGNLWTITATSPTGAVSTASVTKAVTVTQAVNLFALKYGPSASNYSPGRLCGLAITSGGITKWPLFDQCGPGTVNTNRDFYVMGSDGSATLVTNGKVGGTVANTHANRCPYVRDWCAQYGGSYNPNLLSYSGDFSNAIWNKENSTFSAGKVTETAANSFHALYHTDISGIAYPVVFSIKVKSAERTFVSLSLDSGADNTRYATGTFDLTNGTITQQANTSTAVVSWAIDPVDVDGYYRIRVVCGSIGNLTANRIPRLTLNTTGTPTLGAFGIQYYAGNVANGVLVKEPQLERGSVATPYQANATTPNGSFIPGRISSSLDAAGNTKTLAAGKHGNPYSRVVPNPWNAPALVNGGVDSSDKLAPADTYESITTATDDGFSRNKADGTDRYFATLAPLTGSNLTNADNYIG